ncbi:MAG: Asp/Glu/hydantoin racemase [Clostridia bacterium]|nr:Asp/Glu/hydantoin racemase [Clostridia bacterium]
MEYRICLVYTGMPVNLVKRVEQELNRRFDGDTLTLTTQSDPSIIADAVKNGRPSKAALTRLLGMYCRAADAGADAILNVCSSVGDFARLNQPSFRAIGVPLVRIDERMAEEAVKAYTRIGVIATLSSTLEPSLRLVKEKAEQLGRQVSIEGVLAENAFGGGADKLVEAAGKLECPDCLILAQGSMADNETEVAQRTGLKTFSSPYWGALGLYEAVKASEG